MARAGSGEAPAGAWQIWDIRKAGRRRAFHRRASCRSIRRNDAYL